MRLIAVESGRGYHLVVCKACGWRRMLATETAVVRLAAEHLSDVHDEAKRGSNLKSKRKTRGTVALPNVREVPDACA